MASRKPKKRIAQVCVICGAPFESVRVDAKRCPTCAYLHIRVGKPGECTRKKSKMRIVVKNCIDCGQEFQTMHNTKVRCNKCLDRINNKKSAEKRAQVRKKRREESRKEKTNKCAFCGKPCHDKYCNYCINEGLDVVHQITGRTNGFDRKKFKFKPNLDMPDVVYSIPQIRLPSWR